MRTSIGGLLAVLLGFIAAVLSVVTRIVPTRRRGDGNADATVEAAWSSPAELLDGPPSTGRLLAYDRVDASTRDELAAAWRALGRAAYEAIASTARRSLELLALGAPPDLIAAAHADAGDEVRRSKLAFAIARAIDGREVSVMAASSRSGVFTPPAAHTRSAVLAKLAAEMVVEGALAEGVAARMNLKLARRTTDRRIRGALDEMAAAQARHAKHAWAVVEWCLSEGGEVVEHALALIVRLLPPPPPRDVPQVALDGGWERWGIAGSALERQEVATTVTTVERRVTELVRLRTTPGERLVAA